MNAPLRIGISGCGRLARSGYLPALRGLAGLRVDALADPDRARREALAGELERGHSAPRLYAGAAEMLAAGRLDGVLVTSPPAAHLADARAVAAAGIPALIEKPPAADLEGALALADLEPRPLVAFNRRFGLLGSLRDALGPHQGDGLELELELRYRRASWRAHVVADDALLDLGPHLADLATWITGLPAMAARGLEVESESARFELRLGRDSVARIGVATDARHLERGSVSRGGRTIAAVRTPGAVRGLAGRLRGAPHPLVDSLRDVVVAYGAHLHGGAPGRLAGVASAAQTMAALGAVRESRRGGGEWVAIHDVGLADHAPRRRRRAA